MLQHAALYGLQAFDELVFDPHERGPQGDRLTLLFEAVATLPLEEQRVVQAVLDGLIVKHRTRQLAEQHSMPAS